MTTPHAVPPHHHVAIVGTGFAGIGASIKLAEAGVDHVLLERAEDLGGTWRDNSYPGCRCDVPSHLYSLSFAPNPDWSETYSPQPEIQAYLRRTAEEHGVVDWIRFGHDVREARWDEAEGRWHLDTAAGEVTADVLVPAVGAFSEPSIPDLPGLETFEGTTFHSARWRHDHDLTGRRVAAIGTGASAIQFVPAIQPQVEHLTVFQRTAAWVLPHSNRRITDVERTLYRRFPGLQRLPRAFVYWSRELIVGRAMVRNGPLLRRLEKLATRLIDRQVRDPELRKAVTPDFRPGCKRLLLSDDWYPALQKANVDLVTEKVVEVRPNAVVTADGVQHEVDTIIFGTGFRVAEQPIAQRITGVGGLRLSDAWAADGMAAYAGATISGFPNLFMLAGPNTGIGHTSLVLMIEAQITYLLDALRQMRERGLRSVDLKPTALAAWSREIQAKAAPTVWSSGGCASWYLDEEGRNTTLWPDQTYRFVQRTKRFDLEKYDVARWGGPAAQGDEPYGGEEPGSSAEVA
ncbi:MAG TPA: NAD(P)/FAD-dependent oxidoreductase [Acidimicrobiales bacterium]|nr:NAD(P)/FAD-dependent oxidoreductase [Acidimicrobiales bacterium]